MPTGSGAERAEKWSVSVRNVTRLLSFDGGIGGRLVRPCPSASSRWYQPIRPRPFVPRSPIGRSEKARPSSSESCFAPRVQPLPMKTLMPPAIAESCFMAVSAVDVAAGAGAIAGAAVSAFFSCVLQAATSTAATRARRFM